MRFTDSRINFQDDCLIGQLVYIAEVQAITLSEAAIARGPDDQYNKNHKLSSKCFTVS